MAGGEDETAPGFQERAKVVQGTGTGFQELRTEFEELRTGFQETGTGVLDTTQEQEGATQNFFARTQVEEFLPRRQRKTGHVREDPRRDVFSPTRLLEEGPRYFFARARVVESQDTNFMHTDLVQQEMERRQEDRTQEQDDMTKRHEHVTKKQDASIQSQ